MPAPAAAARSVVTSGVVCIQVRRPLRLPPAISTERSRRKIRRIRDAGGQRGDKTLQQRGQQRRTAVPLPRRSRAAPTDRAVEPRRSGKTAVAGIETTNASTSACDSDVPERPERRG
jgi:hypothetical protein